MTNYEKLIADRNALANIIVEAKALDVNGRDPYRVYRLPAGGTSTYIRKDAIDATVDWLDKEAE